LYIEGSSDSGENRADGDGYQKKESMKMTFNPSSDEILTEGDTMIVLGQQSQVNILRELAIGSD
jgi:hypothetical protein